MLTWRFWLAAFPVGLGRASDARSPFAMAASTSANLPARFIPSRRSTAASTLLRWTLLPFAPLLARRCTCASVDVSRRDLKAIMFLSEYASPVISERQAGTLRQPVL